MKNKVLYIDCTFNQNIFILLLNVNEVSYYIPL